MDEFLNCDVLVIGAGIAGLRAALEAAQHGTVIVITKGALGEAATGLAQGGIAAAIETPTDSPLYHFHDTLTAGAGLCDERAVEILVNEGVGRVNELIQMGANFDRAKGAAGFELAIEGAHSRRRVLHAGDMTGREIMRVLLAQTKAQENIQVLSQHFTLRLIMENSRCRGAIVYHQIERRTLALHSGVTIIASGGLGQVFQYTTNPPSATGDGIAFAYGAGAEVADMEFIQFHPTALVHTERFRDLVALPQFLISEAVRGEGGILLNAERERFMHQYHPSAELAPRDVVARAIYQEMQKSGAEHVFLSLEKIPADQIQHRFPNIVQTCKARGLDVTREPIPVAPAAHYAMGGIRTDLNGATNIPGLFAAGETAASGVHGANRLASNSLLEGLVFGFRAGRAAIQFAISQSKARAKPDIKLSSPRQYLSPANHEEYHARIRKIMWENAGIVRSGPLLERALKQLIEMSNELRSIGETPADTEIANMRLVAELVARAALERQESRGAHYRSDFPHTDDAHWRRHLIYRK